MKRLKIFIANLLLIPIVFSSPIYANAKDYTKDYSLTLAESKAATYYGSAFCDFNTISDDFKVNSWGSGVVNTTFEFNVFCFNGPVNMVFVKVYDPDGNLIFFPQLNSYTGTLNEGKTILTLTKPLKKGDYIVEITPGNSGDCRVICTIYK